MSVTALKKGGSVREQVSKEEWQKRVDLAAAYRLVNLYGMAMKGSCSVPTSKRGCSPTWAIMRR